jgi:hypothetical protein
MPKRHRRPLPEPAWRNGPTFRWGTTPPARYKTITDFEIALVQKETVGLQMEWRSVSLGLLTDFVYYSHLEDPHRQFLDSEGNSQRLRDGWRPVGTVERAFLDIDQGFVFAAWTDHRFVYVEYGEDEPNQTIHTWYRVPVGTFDSAWEGLLDQLRAQSEIAAD